MNHNLHRVDVRINSVSIIAARTMSSAMSVERDCVDE